MLFRFAQCRYRNYSQNAGWSSLVARQAHNLKAAGSNPAPATNFLLPMTPGYRVYVLQNPVGKFYIGLPMMSRGESTNTIAAYRAGRKEKALGSAMDKQGF